MSEMIRTRRIAAYIRVSTLEQATNGHSLKMQKDEIDKWAKENNCIIHDYYIDDGYTATNMKRPELLRMLDDSKYFDLIVFIKLDRLVRKVPHYYKIMERLEETKTAWKTIFEDYDTTTQDGQFMINIFLSMAQKEAALASERTKAVFKNRIENGECIISNLPRGYRRVKVNGIYKMEFHPDEAPYIRAMFKHYRQYGSMRRTAKYIVDEFGVYTNTKSFKRILTNPIYIGTYRHKEYGDFPDFAPPLISAKEFYEVQEMMKNNAKYATTNKQVHDYVFQGMLRCPECGRKLSGKKGSRDKLVYRCHKHAGDRACPFSYSIRESRIEKYLLENVRELLSEKIVTYKIEKEKAAVSPVVKMKRQLKSLESKMDELTDMKLAGTIRQEKYEKDFRALESQALNLEGEINKIEISEEHFDISVYESFLEQDFEQIYETLDSKDRRRLWLAVIKHIVIRKDSIEPLFF